MIGVPDDKWGETVKALVVLAPGAAATEAERIAYTRSKLAHYKCPTSVEIRAELARTATGKLQKFVLRGPYWEGTEKLVNRRPTVGWRNTRGRQVSVWAVDRW